LIFIQIPNALYMPVGPMQLTALHRWRRSSIAGTHCTILTTRVRVNCSCQLR